MLASEFELNFVPGTCSNIGPIPSAYTWNACIVPVFLVFADTTKLLEPITIGTVLSSTFGK